MINATNVDLHYHHYYYVFAILFIIVVLQKNWSYLLLLPYVSVPTIPHAY